MKRSPHHRSAGTRRQARTLTTAEEVGEDLLRRYRYDLRTALHLFNVASVTASVVYNRAFSDYGRQVERLLRAILPRRGRDLLPRFRPPEWVREILPPDEPRLLPPEEGPQLELDSLPAIHREAHRSLLSSLKTLEALSHLAKQLSQATFDSMHGDNDWRWVLPPNKKRRPEWDRVVFASGLVEMVEPIMRRTVEPAEVVLLAAFYGLEKLPITTGTDDLGRRARAWRERVRRVRRHPQFPRGESQTP